VGIVGEYRKAIGVFLMGKLHYCLNGEKVTEQVIKFQHSRSSRDYLPIQLYYDDYKDQWFNQLTDYMDRVTFEAEFDFKLCRAVDSFNGSHARALAQKNGWSFLGAFNRWFYKILSNWKSNVKTSAFRIKKRPAVQCPVCDRFVGRIDVEHLKHYKGLSDLPKFFVYKKQIYETTTTPRVQAVCWGEKTPAKWKALESGDVKAFSHEKRRVEWPWEKGGRRVVVCPFTRRLIPIIDEAYIRSLPDKYSRYAEPLAWEEFIERYPSAMIQTEVFSLDHSMMGEDGEVYLRDHVAIDKRVSSNESTLDYEMVCKDNVSSQFEYVFRAISDCVDDDVDQDILKLLAGGYTVDDVADTLEIEKTEVRRRIRSVRDNNKELEQRLLS
jgi:hypothetical protein